MKKSKVIIPAMALLLFSTAASVTSTVAWFTANRTYTMTAGDFAVVNTKDSLECVLTEGIGTHVDNENKSVSVGPVDDDLTSSSWTVAGHSSDLNALTASDVGKIYKDDASHYWICTGAKAAVDVGTTLPANKLTDASFDHTDNANPLIVPDANGEKVAYKPNITTADEDTPGIRREINANVGIIYSAFTWDMEFKLAFGASPASSHVGLYLDTSSADTYMVEADDDSAPDDTGKAFKVAFVPIAVSTGCIGVTKVWGEGQTSALTKFIDGVAQDASLGAGTAYGDSTYTVQYNGSYSASSVESNKALSSSDAYHNVGVPANDTDDMSDCLNNANGFGLGYFAATANTTVSLKFKCVAFYEGTDPNIETASDTDYEVMKLSMKFGVSNLTD